MPGQKGPLPRIIDEGFCNLAVNPGGCYSADAILKSVGQPLAQIIQGSNLFNAVKHTGDVLEAGHDRLTRGFTDPLIDTIEMEPAVQSVETIVKSWSENFPSLKYNGPLTSVMHNAHGQIVKEPLLRLDPTYEERIQRRKVLSKGLEKDLCQVFADKLPNCRQDQLENPPEEEDELDIPFIWEETGTLRSG